MPNNTYYLSGHARSDIAQIRRYTIKKWGDHQWQKYKAALTKKLQSIANNPEIGVVIDEISSDAYRFPLKDHIVYYLKRTDSIIFVGVVPTKMAPEKHLARIKDLSQE